MLNFNILLLLRPPDAYVIDICHRGGKFVYPGRDRGDDIALVNKNWTQN